MQQYFLSQELKLNDLIELPTEISHHLINVLRSQTGETIRLSNQRQLFLAEIIVQKPFVQAVIKQSLPLIEKPTPKITLLISLIKKERFEWVLQKATELGVTRIVPVITANCVVKVNDKTATKLMRWQTICQEAAEQSERLTYPEVLPPISLLETDKYQSIDNFVAYEREEFMIFNPALISNFSDITLIIGPEGGFLKSEIEYLNKIGYLSCSLGKQILRSETAALYMLSSLNFCLK